MKKQSRTRRMANRVGTTLRSWADFDRMKGFTRYLGRGFAKLFIPQHKAAGESFEEAVVRMNLTEPDLLARQKSLYRLAIFMVVLAVLIFVYAVYHIFYGTYRAAGVSFVVMLIALTLAFRYHFWYFQIRSRKLGCTLREWFRQGLMGEQS